MISGKSNQKITNEGGNNLEPHGEKRKKTYFIDENHILKYVHKKFGETTIMTESPEERKRTVNQGNHSVRQV